jgi:hypothetical protein
MDDDDTATESFRRQMLALHIISYSDQDTLWSIARKCAATTGIPLGGGFAVLGAGAGAVTVPGVGSIPGYLAGFLAGLATGTATCTALNLRYRSDLRQFLDDR